ncbi:MAG: DNA photolyase family protein [Oligoflexia bacterium]|nr:DNA photolyase family protein [Oligoflexia bacterium]
MREETWGIHWFRRDLRVAGNKALLQNWKKTNGRTLGIFCFDSKFLARKDFSHNRFGFFLKTLKSLQKELESQGGSLLVVDQLPKDFFHELILFLKKKKINLPKVISWNRDYEPFARNRDREIEFFLKELSIEVLTERDHLLFEPHEILKAGKSDSSYYQIYSPFSRKWFDLLNSDLGLSRVQEQSSAKKYFNQKNKDSELFKLSWHEVLSSSNIFNDQLKIFEAKNSTKVTIDLPEAGFAVAYTRLKEFSEKLIHYKKKRDIPSEKATSNLSIYLKNGSLTVTQILHELAIKNLHWNDASGAVQYVKELAWREFYYHILFHQPEVEAKEFQVKYENLNWENNKEFFEKWKEGKTGFPIIDAGMRQLKTTGWMHNRVRMIVASFLTKDLLIDWRWGERYFMEQLLDGDLAANNGGWQWAASTGCDPQPYFRIFNPWLQSKKFDPDGEYIKKYVPELNEAPSASLHEPDFDRSKWKYVKPIVSHALQKNKAIQMYKK